MNKLTETPPRSVLAALRSVIPDREVVFAQARKVAEIQANRFLALCDVEFSPVPSKIVSSLPRIRIVFEKLPTWVSGTSHWNGTHWIIVLNKSEPPVRQRFTLMHEFKHIIDHGRTDLLYTGNSRYTAVEQAERAADYFAACVLMPKKLLKAAWSRGIQTSARLARDFDVSTVAMEVRLSQTRLSAEQDTYFQVPTRALARGRQAMPQRPLSLEGAS
ncbi:ImmA/IrrE family metallo-endopeptidase [Kribbella sp. NPDC058693]|uniref:ImmA/IrrE family metallo-endopeptidase n=1 Tax=Kribbella sp. NPDC058693 TaxID=3346602 RepID=UPI003646414C